MCMFQLIASRPDPSNISARAGVTQGQQTKKAAPTVRIVDGFQPALAGSVAKESDRTFSSFLPAIVATRGRNPRRRRMFMSPPPNSDAHPLRLSHATSPARPVEVAQR